METAEKEGKIMYNKVLALLQEEYPEVDFTSSDELVDEGILDSLTLTGIIAALSMEFDIEIPYDEIIEENFILRRNSYPRRCKHRKQRCIGYRGIQGLAP